ncbi:MAG: GntR family transcriptional regulator [Alphaproteobacteria bacterium]|nr:GntR family transcriptional regulator [Alphaproteobacteria bacterium]MDE2499546.1 GntR family transcriptional regulator [Alphaproteobacteria bacterium]
MGIIARTLSDQAFEIIRGKILKGEIAPGTPVRQEAIAIDLGVSKIPLREALGRLEQEGLLSSQPNRGFVVRPLSADEAEEIFALRLKLEPEATARSAALATDMEREAATVALRMLNDDMENGGRQSETLNRAFHVALIRPAGGPITVQLVERLHVLAERYVHVHLSPSGRNLRASREHNELLKAWKKREADKVAMLSTRHIEGTLKDLRKELKSATPSAGVLRVAKAS